MGAHAVDSDVEPAKDKPAEDPSAKKNLVYHGAKFRIHPDGVSEFAQLELAEMITSGGDGTSYSDQAAILRTVIDAVHPDDRLSFRAACREHRATVDELLELISTGTVGDERPFEAPGASTPGPTSIEPKSESNSSETATSRTAFPGRPDLQLIESMVLEQQAV